MTKKPRRSAPEAEKPPAKPRFSPVASGTADHAGAKSNRPRADRAGPADAEIPAGAAIAVTSWDGARRAGNARGEAEEIVLWRLSPAGYAASVSMSGVGRAHQEAADVATLMGWLEAMERPTVEQPDMAGQETRLAEDRLEELLVLAGQQAARERFDLLRGEALAQWSEIEMEMGRA